MPLIELEPPSVLPRGQWIARPAVPAEPSAQKFQFTTGWCSSFSTPAGNMDPNVAVGRPGLQQDHASTGLGEAAGDDAAGRAGADHHIVRVHVVPLATLRGTMVARVAAPGKCPATHCQRNDGGIACFSW